ncbi:MAG: methyltransferase domain-containing protein [Candidatus Woesearchaeota archaeon]|nr:methyltransferase domain-containing protein [Candidatus Woesearchaeota archaeon]
MLLHDGARVSVYHKSIDVLSELNKSQSECYEPSPRRMRILDAGTGSGVWAIDLAKAFPNAAIDAVDYHADVVEFAKKQISLWPSLSDRINVIQGDLTGYSGSEYDLIVTELDGGVGNNEGEKRVFNNLRKLCSHRGTIIPDSIQININPVEVPDFIILGNYLQPSERKEKCRTDLYYLIDGLQPEAELCSRKNFDGFKTKYEITEGIEKILGFEISRKGKLTGFIAWFIQELINYPINSNCPFPIRFSNSTKDIPTSWGQAYFPVEPFDVKHGDEILLNFAEVITPAGPIPHYDWSVVLNGKLIGQYSNEKNQERRR